MAVKHLHELLQEEQEPFQLKSFIAQRRSQFSTPATKLTSQFEKQRPISSNLTSQQKLCKKACFFSFQNSPDVTQSPFFDIPRPPETRKTPSENPKSVRPTKQQSKKPSSKIEPNERFGVFGSILKKLSSRKRSQSREFRPDIGVHSAPTNSVTGERKSISGKTTLFESLERDCEDMDFLVQSATLEGENGNFSPCDLHFCSPPFSPFRFSLHSSPSSVNRTPIFTSPATSPGGPTKQENCEVGSEEKIIVETAQDEKEQSSPVSVLDPPFADEDESGHEGNTDDDHDGGYNLECCYQTMQRSKNELLLKLQRFEKLAELDPIELERLLLEDPEEDSDSEDLQGDCGFVQMSSEENVEGLVTEVLNNSGIHITKISHDMKKLALDLILEERRLKNGEVDDESVVKRVCTMFDSWKETKSVPIEPMVEKEMAKEFDQQRCNNNQEVVTIGEISTDIANDIFGMLVEEFSEGLILDFAEAVSFSF